jgi:chromosome segregation ATPase
VIGHAFATGDFGLVEIGLLFAAAAYVTQIALDALGFSRSSKLLRQENEDLVRRNLELDQKVGALKSEVAKLDSELSALRAQVGEMSKRDQAAVLAALEQHEVRADHRAARGVELLTQIRDELQLARRSSSPTIVDA